MTKKEYILDFLKEINCAYNHQAMYDDLKRLLDEMEEEVLENANCKWIPCEKRLPDKLNDVIVTFCDAPEEYDIAYMRKTFNATYKANGAENEWVSAMGETTYADYEVIAWMPIIPYKDGDENGNG